MTGYWWTVTVVRGNQYSILIEFFFIVVVQIVWFSCEVYYVHCEGKNPLKELLKLIETLNLQLGVANLRILLVSLHPYRFLDCTIASYTAPAVNAFSVYPLVWIGPSEYSAGIVISFQNECFDWWMPMLPVSTWRNFNLYSLIGDWLSVCQIKFWLVDVDVWCVMKTEADGTPE